MKYNRRRGLKMFAVAALLPMMALAQVQKPAATGDQDPAVAQMKQLVQGLVSNLQHDRKIPENFFADELILTSHFGEVSSKAAYLESYDAHPRTVKLADKQNASEAKDFIVHTYGDEMAVLNCLLVAHNVEHSVRGDVRSNDEYRATVSFLKRDDRWQAVALQTTHVSHSSSTEAHISGALLTSAKPADGPQDTVVVDQITQIVRDFLANVPRNDPEVFKEFFADDVIYTRATGVTVAKADILKNIAVRATNTPEATFAADDFIVHPYGDMAIVNFRLIGHNVETNQPTTYFRNTGMFLKRDGRWQAIAWQATRILESK